MTAKPSAYYEVRPVELEPEAPARLPGIVLSLGAFVIDLQTPNIGATESDLVYTLPAELGGAQVTSRVSPARVGPAGAPPPPTNVLRLRGAALGKGQRRRLLLSHAHWGRLFPELRRIPVDLALNAGLGWAQSVTGGLAEIAVGNELRFRRTDGSEATVALYPGAYAASWRVTNLFEAPDEPREVDERSNDAVFTVNPRIVSVARDGGTGAVTLGFGGAWRLDRGRPPPPDPVAEPELDILLAVDAAGYRLVGFADPAEPGTFVISPHELTYRPTPAANASGLHALRVVVDGADAQPFWIEIP